MSLKEEIKLLCCKGFHQRLVFFLNIFKYLVVTNFHEIFNFLLANQSPTELITFLDECRFLLPGDSGRDSNCQLWD